MKQKILAVLENGCICTATRVAELVGHSRGSVSKALTRLVRSGDVMVDALAHPPTYRLSVRETVNP